MFESSFFLGSPIGSLHLEPKEIVFSSPPGAPKREGDSGSRGISG